MRVTIKPTATPDRELDITGALIAAVATELWKNGGGNDVLNWMEAERFVESLIAGRQSAAEVKPRQHARPVPARDDRPARRRMDADPDRVTGPLPVW